MQQGLFEDHNLLTIGYQKDLRHFRLAGAYEKLLELKEKRAGRKALSGKVEAFVSLQTLAQELEAGDIRALANLCLGLAGREALSGLNEDVQDIEEGFMREIAGRLGADDIDYIVPELHPAQVFLRIGEFDRAVDVVDRYCRDIGENTALRQLQGYAFWKNGINSRAKHSMSLALFADPLLCEEEMLVPEDFRKKLEDLQSQMESHEEAWLELPFTLWKRRMLPIVTDVPCAVEHLKQLLEEDRPAPELDKTRKAKRFLRLMYLAEISRLTTDDLFQKAYQRQLMKEVDPEKFAMYMQTI